MNILDRYLFGFFIRYFFGALVLLTGFALITRAIGIIHHLVKYTGSAVHIYRYFYLYIPNMISILLPAALLFSIAFSITSFSKHNELNVMMTSGRSFKRILMPLALFSFLLSFFMLWFNEMVTAKANFKATNELNIIKGKPSAFRLFNQSNFEIKSNNRYYHLGFFNAKEEEAYNVHIVELYSNGHIKRIIEAQKVKIMPKVWQFENGTILLFDNQGLFQKSYQFKRKIIPLPESPAYFQDAEKKFEEMNIFDLEQYIKKKKEKAEPAIEYEVEYFWHLGYPFICFFIVLLGGYIGIFLKKGSLAQSIGVSVTISVIYYFLMYFSKALGNSGFLQPFLAGWLANIIFLLFSIFLLFRFKK
ncbi:MAG: LptF/LptG family permease [Spirochaetia bacterium]|nr:LptF/LptG family permease [Spirochaetia bacterium]